LIFVRGTIAETANVEGDPAEEEIIVRDKALASLDDFDLDGDGDIDLLNA
jgi:hypothetical protein